MLYPGVVTLALAMSAMLSLTTSSSKLSRPIARKRIPDAFEPQSLPVRLVRYGPLVHGIEFQG